MDRKKAIGLATSVSVAAAGAALAVGANLGLFGVASARTAPDLPVSTIADVSAGSQPAPEEQVIEETRIIDVPVHVPAAPSGTTTSGSVAVADDDVDAGDDADVDDSYLDEGDDDVAPTASAAPTYDDRDDDSHEGEDEDEDDGIEREREDDECEVHDDGDIECHDEDD